MTKPPSAAAAPFEIGLVMAGACSAGAYTAGVIDFLFEALDAWETARATGDPAIPDHRVVIRAASGTSAGGIVAALIGMLPFTGRYPVTDLAGLVGDAEPANADRNLLYRSWVRDIDIRGLLETGDIDKATGRVPSLLNGEAVVRVADQAVAMVRDAVQGPLPPAPAWLADPLQLFLCFTNMQGVPYVIRMASASEVRGHWVTSHAGCAHFAVFGTGAGQAEERPPGAIVVNSPDTLGFPELDGWTWLRDAALASSAFPGGLPARPFRHRRAYHEGKHWFGPGTLPIPEDAVDIAPMLSRAGSDSPEFWCVDGGLINNEPLEYARAAIRARHAGGSLTGARDADHSFILIDPFPEDESKLTADSPPQPDMLSAVVSLLSILRAQAQFKPEEVMKALSEDIRTRCLIAPTRDDALGNESNLASSGLAGFSGFLNRQFRMHDFQLGRANCQRFLRDHFFVHVDNPLVRPWVSRRGADAAAVGRYHPTLPTGYGTFEPGECYLQVIPLVGDAARPVVPRPWPRLAERDAVRPLKPLITARTRAVVPGTVLSLLGRLGITDRRLIGRIIRAVASDVITDRVGEAIIDAIVRDLRSRGLV
jgi:predicted acylesterase/phospholipase RssA